jgi:hypothetical protein
MFTNTKERLKKFFLDLPLIKFLSKKKFYKKTPRRSFSLTKWKSINLCLYLILTIFVLYNILDKDYILSSCYFKKFDDWFNFFCNDTFYRHYRVACSWERYVSKWRKMEFYKAERLFSEVTNSNWEYIKWRLNLWYRIIRGIILSIVDLVLKFLLHIETIMIIIKFLYDIWTKWK